MRERFGELLQWDTSEHDWTEGRGEKMYRVSNENNALEIVLDPDKEKTPSVMALKAKFHGWRGATPADAPHLKLSSTWSETLDKRITQTQIENGYTDNLIEIEEIKRSSLSDHLSWIVPLALMVILWVFFMRRMGGGGGSQIFKAETPGPMKDTKLTPRIAETAKGLWLVYFSLTGLCLLSFR